MPGPRRTPQTPDQQAVHAETLPPIDKEAQEAFNLGIKRSVTPRGETKIDLIIRQFYTDQALEIVDQLETVYGLVREMSDEKGNVDLMNVFREAKEEVFAILLKSLDGQIKDRKTLGKLEIDDLLNLFNDVFTINKDFFVLRVKGQLTNVLGQVSMLS